MCARQHKFHSRGSLLRIRTREDTGWVPRIPLWNLRLPIAGISVLELTKPEVDGGELTELSLAPLLGRQRKPYSCWPHIRIVNVRHRRKHPQPRGPHPLQPFLPRLLLRVAAKLERELVPASLV